MRRIAQVLVIAVSLQLGFGPAAPVAADSKKAELALPDLEGQPHSLAELRGRIVVVNFWATWCTPCREELPMLARVHRAYADAGVEFIGASSDRDSARAAILALVEQSGVRYPIWIGAEIEDMERFGLGPVIPATAIVRRDGTIARRFSGTIEESELRRHLDRLLERDDAPRERERDELPGGQMAAGTTIGGFVQRTGDAQRRHVS